MSDPSADAPVQRGCETHPRGSARGASVKNDSSSFRVDHLFVRLEDADLAAVLERLEADPIALVGRRIEDQYIRHVQGCFALDDSTLNAHLRIRTLVLLAQVESLDAHAIIRQHLDD